MKINVQGKILEVPDGLNTDQIDAIVSDFIQSSSPNIAMSGPTPAPVDVMGMQPQQAPTLQYPQQPSPQPSPGFTPTSISDPLVNQMAKKVFQGAMVNSETGEVLNPFYEMWEGVKASADLGRVFTNIAAEVAPDYQFSDGTTMQDLQRSYRKIAPGGRGIGGFVGGVAGSVVTNVGAMAVGGPAAVGANLAWNALQASSGVLESMDEYEQRSGKQVDPLMKAASAIVGGVLAVGAQYVSLGRLIGIQDDMQRELAPKIYQMLRAKAPKSEIIKFALKETLEAAGESATPEALEEFTEYTGNSLMRLAWDPEKLSQLKGNPLGYLKEFAIEGSMEFAGGALGGTASGLFGGGLRLAKEIPRFNTYSKVFQDVKRSLAAAGLDKVDPNDYLREEAMRSIYGLSTIQKLPDGKYGIDPRLVMNTTNPFDATAPTTDIKRIGDLTIQDVKDLSNVSIDDVQAAELHKAIMTSLVNARIKISTENLAFYPELNQLATQLGTTARAEQVRTQAEAIVNLMNKVRRGAKIDNTAQDVKPNPTVESPNVKHFVYEDYTNPEDSQKPVSNIDLTLRYITDTLSGFNDTDVGRAVIQNFMDIVIDKPELSVLKDIGTNMDTLTAVMIYMTAVTLDKNNVDVTDKKFDMFRQLLTASIYKLHTSPEINFPDVVYESGKSIVMFGIKSKDIMQGLIQGSTRNEMTLDLETALDIAADIPSSLMEQFETKDPTQAGTIMVNGQTYSVNEEFRSIVDQMPKYYENLITPLYNTLKADPMNKDFTDAELVNRAITMILSPEELANINLEASVSKDEYSSILEEAMTEGKKHQDEADKAPKPIVPEGYSPQYHGMLNIMYKLLERITLDYMHPDKLSDFIDKYIETGEPIPKLKVDTDNNYVRLTPQEVDEFISDVIVLQNSLDKPLVSEDYKFNNVIAQLSETISLAIRLFNEPNWGAKLEKSKSFNQLTEHHKKALHVLVNAIADSRYLLESKYAAGVHSTQIISALETFYFLTDSIIDGTADLDDTIEWMHLVDEFAAAGIGLDDHTVFGFNKAAHTKGMFSAIHRAGEIISGKESLIPSILDIEQVEPKDKDVIERLNSGTLTDQDRVYLAKAFEYLRSSYTDSYKSDNPIVPQILEIIGRMSQSFDQFISSSEKPAIRYIENTIRTTVINLVHNVGYMDALEVSLREYLSNQVVSSGYVMVSPGQVTALLVQSQVMSMLRNTTHPLAETFSNTLDEGNHILYTLTTPNMLANTLEDYQLGRPQNDVDRKIAQLVLIRLGANFDTDNIKYSVSFTDSEQTKSNQEQFRYAAEALVKQMLGEDMLGFSLEFTDTPIPMSPKAVAEAAKRLGISEAEVLSRVSSPGRVDLDNKHIQIYLRSMPIGASAHEASHVLLALHSQLVWNGLPGLFSKAEMDALNKVYGDVIDQFGMQTEDMRINEEHLFDDMLVFSQSGPLSNVKHHPLITRVFNKIVQFLSRMLERAGFVKPTKEDVFQRMVSGDVISRIKVSHILEDDRSKLVPFLTKMGMLDPKTGNVKHSFLFPAEYFKVNPLNVNRTIDLATYLDNLERVMSYRDISTREMHMGNMAKLEHMPAYVEAYTKAERLILATEILGYLLKYLGISPDVEANDIHKEIHKALVAGIRTSTVEAMEKESIFPSFMINSIKTMNSSVLVTDFIAATTGWLLDNNGRFNYIGGRGFYIDLNRISDLVHSELTRYAELQRTDPIGLDELSTNPRLVYPSDTSTEYISLRDLILDDDGELFSIMPELNSVRVTLTTYINTLARGASSLTSPTITIHAVKIALDSLTDEKGTDTQDYVSYKSIVKTLLHEVQHQVDRISGVSFSEGQTYKTAPKEVRARAAANYALTYTDMAYEEGWQHPMTMHFFVSLSDEFNFNNVMTISDKEKLLDRYSPDKTESNFKYSSTAPGKLVACYLSNCKTLDEVFTRLDKSISADWVNDLKNILTNVAAKTGKLPDPAKADQYVSQAVNAFTMRGAEFIVSTFDQYEALDKDNQYLGNYLSLFDPSDEAIATQIFRDWRNALTRYGDYLTHDQKIEVALESLSKVMAKASKKTKTIDDVIPEKNTQSGVDDAPKKTKSKKSKTKKSKSDVKAEPQAEPQAETISEDEDIDPELQQMLKGEYTDFEDVPDAKELVDVKPKDKTKKSKASKSKSEDIETYDGDDVEFTDIEAKKPAKPVKTPVQPMEPVDYGKPDKTVETATDYVRRLHSNITMIIDWMKDDLSVEEAVGMAAQLLVKPGQATDANAINKVAVALVEALSPIKDLVKKPDAPSSSTLAQNIVLQLIKNIKAKVAKTDIDEGLKTRTVDDIESKIGKRSKDFPSEPVIPPEVQAIAETDEKTLDSILPARTRVPRPAPTHIPKRVPVRPDHKVQIKMLNAMIKGKGGRVYKKKFNKIFGARLGSAIYELYKAREKAGKLQSSKAAEMIKTAAKAVGIIEYAQSSKILQTPADTVVIQAKVLEERSQEKHQQKQSIKSQPEDLLEPSPITIEDAYEPTITEPTVVPDENPQVEDVKDVKPAEPILTKTEQEIVDVIKETTASEAPQTSSQQIEQKIEDVKTAKKDQKPERKKVKLYRHTVDWSKFEAPVLLRQIIGRHLTKHQTRQLGVGTYWSRNPEAWSKYRGDGGRVDGITVAEVEQILKNEESCKFLGINKGDKELESINNSDDRSRILALESWGNRISEQLTKMISEFNKTGPMITFTKDVYEDQIQVEHTLEAAQKNKSEIVEHTGDDEIIIRRKARSKSTPKAEPKPKPEPKPKAAPKPKEKPTVFEIETRDLSNRSIDADSLDPDSRQILTAVEALRAEDPSIDTVIKNYCRHVYLTRNYSDKPKPVAFNSLMTTAQILNIQSLGLSPDVVLAMGAFILGYDYMLTGNQDEHYKAVANAIDENKYVSPRHFEFYPDLASVVDLLPMPAVRLMMDDLKLVPAGTDNQIRAKLKEFIGAAKVQTEQFVQSRSVPKDLTMVAFVLSRLGKSTPISKIPKMLDTFTYEELQSVITTAVAAGYAKIDNNLLVKTSDYFDPEGMTALIDAMSSTMLGNSIPRYKVSDAKLAAHRISELLDIALPNLKFQKDPIGAGTLGESHAWYDKLTKTLNYTGESTTSDMAKAIMSWLYHSYGSHPAVRKVTSMYDEHQFVEELARYMLGISDKTGIIKVGLDQVKKAVEAGTLGISPEALQYALYSMLDVAKMLQDPANNAYKPDYVDQATKITLPPNGHKAPDGASSRLDEYTWRVTQTEYFKGYFGSSIFVDEHNEPMGFGIQDDSNGVVYYTYDPDVSHKHTFSTFINSVAPKTISDPRSGTLTEEDLETARKQGYDSLVYKAGDGKVVVVPLYNTMTVSHLFAYDDMTYLDADSKHAVQYRDPAIDRIEQLVYQGSQGWNMGSSPQPKMFSMPKMLIDTWKWMKRLVDYKSLFNSIHGPKTGFEIQNFASNKATWISWWGVQNRDVHKEIRKNGLNWIELIRATEDESYLQHMKDRDLYKGAVKILRDAFDTSLDTLKRYGVLKAGYTENLSKRMRDMAAVDPQNSAELLQLAKWVDDNLHYMHVPAQLIVSALTSDSTKTPAIRKFLGYTNKRQRVKSFTLSSLFDAGIISPNDISLSDILASYADRFSSDLSFAIIAYRAKQEGLAIKAFKNTTPPKGFVEAPANAPMFGGHYLRAELARWIAETSLNKVDLTWVSKTMTAIKMMRFYNPFMLTMINTTQAAMVLPPHIASHPIKAIRMLYKTWKDIHYCTDDWMMAHLNGLASKPFVEPWQNNKELFDWLAANGQKRLAIALGDMMKCKPLPIITAFYKLSNALAWRLDDALRMYGYNVLRSSTKMSSLEAAQVMADFSGNYATVDPKIRNMMNKVFFTPTFKVVMLRLYYKMMAGALKTITSKTKVSDRAYAWGLLNGVVVIAAIEWMMHKIGFESTQFGRQYRKRVVNEDGASKDLYITFNHPANMFTKYYYRFLESNTPDVDNPLATYLQKNRYELHPVYQTLYAVATNRRLDGTEIANRKDENYWLDVTKYVVLDSINVLNALVEGRATDESARAMAKEFGKGMAIVSKLIAFPYITEPAEVRLYMRIKAEWDELMKMYLRGEMNTKRMGAAKKTLEYLIDEAKALQLRREVEEAQE